MELACASRSLIYEGKLRDAISSMISAAHSSKMEDVTGDECSRASREGKSGRYLTMRRSIGAGRVEKVST